VRALSGPRNRDESVKESAMNRARLSDDEITRRIPEIPGFQRDGDKLVADFKFKNFADAFAFMTSAAFVAEKLDHHPEWSNVYNRVHVALTTHDSGGITELDFAFAARAVELSRRYVV
jgi:4a-hydroxytetrahydrobiopterin dehydratase